MSYSDESVCLDLELTEVDDDRTHGTFSESSHHSRTQPKKGCAKAQRKGEKTAQLKRTRGDRLWNESLSEFDTIQSYIAAGLANEMCECEQRQQRQQQRQEQRDSPEARRLHQRKRRAAARARVLAAQQKH